MVRRIARKGREKKEISDERMGDLDKVILAGMEKLVAVRVGEKKILQWVGKNEKELTPEEIKRLPEAAKWAMSVREALESGKPKNLDKVA